MWCWPHFVAVAFLLETGLPYSHLESKIEPTNVSVNLFGETFRGTSGHESVPLHRKVPEISATVRKKKKSGTSLIEQIIGNVPMVEPLHESVRASERLNFDQSKRNNFPADLNLPVQNSSCHAAICVAGTWAAFDRPVVRKLFRKNLLAGLSGKIHSDRGGSLEQNVVCKLDLFFRAVVGPSRGNTSSVRSVSEILEIEFPEAKNISVLEFQGDDSINIENNERTLQFQNKSKGPQHYRGRRHRVGTIGDYIDNFLVERHIRRAQNSLQNTQDCYTMVEAEESSSRNGHEYDWIVHTHFDVGYYGQFMPLQLFNRTGVHIPYTRFPIGDNFAILPRVYAPVYSKTGGDSIESTHIPAQYRTIPSFLLFEHLIQNLRAPLHLHDFPISTITEDAATSCDELPNAVILCERLVLSNLFHRRSDCTRLFSFIALTQCAHSFERPLEEFKAQGFDEISLNELEIRVALLNDEFTVARFEQYDDFLPDDGNFEVEFKSAIRVLGVQIDSNKAPLLKIVYGMLNHNASEALYTTMVCILETHIRHFNDLIEEYAIQYSHLLKKLTLLVIENDSNFCNNYNAESHQSMEIIHRWQTSFVMDIKRMSMIRIFAHPLAGWEASGQIPEESNAIVWGAGIKESVSKQQHFHDFERQSSLPWKSKHINYSFGETKVTSNHTELLWDHQSPRTNGGPLFLPGITIFRLEEISRIEKTTYVYTSPLRTPNHLQSCGTKPEMTKVYDKDGQILSFNVDGLLSDMELERKRKKAESETLLWFAHEGYEDQNGVESTRKVNSPKAKNRRHYTMNEEDRRLSQEGYPGFTANVKNEVEEEDSLCTCLEPLLADLGYSDNIVIRRDRSNMFKFSLAYPLSIHSQSIGRFKRKEYLDAGVHDNVLIHNNINRSQEDQDLEVSSWAWHTHRPHVDAPFGISGFAGTGSLTRNFNDTGIGFYVDKVRNISAVKSKKDFEEVLYNSPHSSLSEYLNSRPHFKGAKNPFGLPYSIDNEYTRCILINFLQYGRFTFYRLDRLNNLFIDDEALKRLSVDPKRGRLTYDMQLRTVE